MGTSEQRSSAADVAAYRRVSLPLAQAVLWRRQPPPGVAPVDPLAHPWPLFVTQKLLTDLVAAATWPGGAFGFLIGGLFEDADCGIRYAVASQHLRLVQPFQGDATLGPVEAGWNSMRAEVLRLQGDLIGWYHSHGDRPLAPTADDRSTQHKWFAEPWHVMLLVGSVEGAAQGWWYRPQERERAALPFYELFDTPPEGAAARVSRMSWTGYVPDDPAVVVAPPPAEPSERPSQLHARFIHPAAFTPPPVTDGDDEVVFIGGPPPSVPRLTGELVWQATAHWGRWGRAASIAGLALMVGFMLYGIYALAVGGSPAPPVMVTAPPVAAPAASTSPEQAELETAMRGFADAERMFGTGQGTCDVLARNLVRVEEAWLGYNTARRNAAGSSSNLAAAAAGDDAPLVAAVDSVETRFERLQCPRP